MKQHHTPIPILFLSILLIVSLTACQSVNSQASITDNPPNLTKLLLPQKSYFLSKKHLKSIRIKLL